MPIPSIWMQFPKLTMGTRKGLPCTTMASTRTSEDVPGRPPAAARPRHSSAEMDRPKLSFALASWWQAPPTLFSLLEY